MSHWDYDQKRKSDSIGTVSESKQQLTHIKSLGKNSSVALVFPKEKTCKNLLRKKHELIKITITQIYFDLTLNTITSLKKLIYCASNKNTIAQKVNLLQFSLSLNRITFA